MPDMPLISTIADVNMRIFPAGFLFFGIVAIILGATACFAGYKIMRQLIAIWGLFIGILIGAIIGSLAHSSIVGGLLALIFSGGLVFLGYRYKTGGTIALVVFFVVAAFSAVMMNVLEAGKWWIMLLCAFALGAVAAFAATRFTKPVVIGASALGGTGIMFISASFVILGNLGAGLALTLILWIPISIFGIGVQMLTTIKKTIYVPGAKTPEEKRFPGMQTVCKNFCVKCGAPLVDGESRCPKCGFSDK